MVKFVRQGPLSLIGIAIAVAIGIRIEFGLGSGSAIGVRAAVSDLDPDPIPIAVPIAIARLRSPVRGRSLLKLGLEKKQRTHRGAADLSSLAREK